MTETAQPIIDHRAEKGNDLRHEGHPDPEIAYHIPWAFRREAFIWKRGLPVKPNFHPIGTELRSWLLCEVTGLPVLSCDPTGQSSNFTNPYTASGSTLAVIYTSVINEAYDFVHGSKTLADIDAESKRYRLYVELVLYTSRICEALIKQLLYCTGISTKTYKDAALGALLQKPCYACKKAGKPEHKISLLGSLAHRYQLCYEVEHCLEKNLRIVKRRRDVDAAHATLSGFEPDHPDGGRKRLSSSVIEIGEELVHMLQHISNIEKCMSNELTIAILNGIEHPWWKGNP